MKRSIVEMWSEDLDEGISNFQQHIFKYTMEHFT